MRILTRSVAGPVIAGLVLLSLASAIVVGIGIAVLSRAGSMSDDIQMEGRRALLAERMNGLVMAVVMESRGVYFSKDTTDAVRFATPLRAFLRRMEATLDEWRPLIPEARKPQFVELEKAVRDFITFRTETARLGTEVSPDAANRQGNNEQNRNNRRALNTALEAVAKAGQAEQARLDAELESFSTTNMMIMSAGSLTAVIVAFAIAFWLLRSRVTKPLLDLAATMDALAAGKPTGDPPGSGRVDEIGSMAKAVQVFARNAQHLAENRAAEQARVAAERSRIEQAERIAAAAALVVEGARRGDFSRRANVVGADGDVAALASGLDDVCVAAGRFLDELDQVAAAMASGDLGQRLTTGLGGRFDIVAESLNSSLDMLSTTFEAIAEGAATTSEASMQIRSVAMDLSKRSESQAASVEEMSAAIEEFSSSVKETATNATSMGAAAHNASAEAEKGGDITQRAIAAMGRIEGSTTKVRDIVVLIDGIAFQTNLLALNAAVEAARAGEHGRGFAVVATEVRRLAQQAGQAAQDIRRLIDESTTEIAGGVTLVRNAGTVLEGIIERVRALASTLGEITTAAGEQARGVEEIARAVGAIDQMTQQNAAAAEENASAAGSMAQTAEELTATVATFRSSGVQRRRRAA